MPEQWFSYRQLSKLWNISPEAARARTRRGNWQRRTNNAGVAEVLVDTDAPIPEPRQKAQDEHLRTATPAATPDAATTSRAVLEALEGHIATLKDQLAKVEALAAERGREIAAERERVADLTAQLLKLTGELLEARKADTPRRSWWQRLIG
jgi:chromosome segregation ATPase